MTTKYADIGKEGDDLFSKGFPAANSSKFIWERAPLDGFELKQNVERTLTDKEQVFFTVEPTFSPNNLFKLKGKYTTKPEKEVSLEVNNLFTQGSLVELGVTEKEKSYYGSLGYVNDKFNFSVKATQPWDVTKQTPVYNAFGVYKGDPFRSDSKNLFGFNASFKKTANIKDNKEVAYGPQYDTQLNGKFQFTEYNTTISLNSTFEFKKGNAPRELSLSLLMQQYLSDSLKVSSKYTLNSDIQVFPTLDVVLEKKSGEETYKSKISVVSKAQTELKFSFAATSKISQHATFTLGADVNARDFIGPKTAESIGFGFEVKFK